MTLTPSPMKISEAARLAALLNARLVARPGRLDLEAAAAMQRPTRPAPRPSKPTLRLVGA